METRLKKHLTNLKTLDRERQHWLRLSAFVVLSVFGVIFEWNFVMANRLAWLLVSCGLIVTVIWWYWTMRFIRHLLESKNDEYLILNDIITDVSEIKQDIRDTFFNTIDKSK